MWSRLFGRGKPAQEAEEPLLIVPVPALVAVLLAKRTEKGADLTEAEVLRIRDDAVCIAMPADVAWKMAEARGYDDIDPENVWEEWQDFLRDYLAGDGNAQAD